MRAGGGSLAAQFWPARGGGAALDLAADKFRARAATGSPGIDRSLFRGRASASFFAWAAAAPWAFSRELINFIFSRASSNVRKIVSERVF